MPKRALIRIVLSVALLSACSQRGVITVDPQAGAVGQVEKVYFATTRKIGPDTTDFGSDRSEAESFGRYDISVPPDRKAGEISFPRPGRPVDPRTQFLTTEAVVYDAPGAFQSDLSGALRSDRAGKGDAVVYVHGFNNTFAEGIYRMAQLSHDVNSPAVTLHYSWPSGGNPLGYVYDRDSATFARDGLEDMLREIEGAGAKRIILVAHSMGASLTMEVLRQIAIRGDRRLLSRIGGVILISPDIDVDVFRTQARAIGTLPEPFLIFGSDRDRYLNLSAIVAGEPERLGNLKDVSRVADLKITFLDVAAYSSGAGHFALGDSPALLSLLSKVGDIDAVLGSEQKGKVGFFPGVVLSVQSATQVILSPVAALGAN